MAKQQKPSERTWSIPCGVLTEEGDWLEQPGMLGQGLAELQAVLSRTGGVVQMAAVREELQPVAPTEQSLPSQLCTTSLFVRWQSFSPATTKATAEVAES